MKPSVGRTVQTLATVFPVLTVIGSLIIGIVYGTLIGQASLGLGVLFAVIIIAVGCFSAWVTNVLLSGFAEIIQNTNSILTAQSQARTAQSTMAPPVYASPAPAATPAPTAFANSSALVRRGFLSLEDGNWAKADALFEDALSLEPENAHIYIGKLCAQLHLTHESDLVHFWNSLAGNTNYNRALQFADPDYFKTIERYSMTPEQIDAAQREETSFSGFVTFAETLGSSKEILDAFQVRESAMPPQLRQLVGAKLKECANNERMYGNMKRTSVRLLHEYAAQEQASVPPANQPPTAS